MATWIQWGFQDSASPLIEEFSYFYDFTIIVLWSTITIVIIIILYTYVNKLPTINVLERQVLECIWTFIPALVLVLIAIPSLSLLYLLDDTGKRDLSIKVVAHQWYWSYEYTDCNIGPFLLEFDSYLEIRNINSIIRLLDVDNSVSLPFLVNIRIIVTSSDVLHSWAVPALGLKADAVPGRLNQLSVFLNRPGFYFGQCSEICGANHRFIPITIQSIKPLDFWKMIYTLPI